MATPSITITLTVGSEGFVNTPPSTINSNYLTAVNVADPTLTVNLPGTLIEDVTNTATAAIMQIDSLAVDLGNSISPLTSNPWITVQLGNIYGVPQGQDTNTSVYVVFSGTVGWNVYPGLLVGDGTYQYIVQSPGGAIGAGGSTVPLYCIATVAGSWAIPQNTVTTIASTVPGGITLTCTNPTTGTPGTSGQTLEDYRAQVLQAGLASATGMPRLLKTAVGILPGVQQRLVAMPQVVGTGYKVIVGGGDPYQIAGAIYSALFDFTTLVPSSIGITGITNANPGVVTTNLNHGLTSGQSNVYIAGVQGMPAANGGPYTVTVISPTTFSFGVNTTSFGGYTSGGVVTPNSRNITVNLIDTPDTYSITFINPPQQSVTVQLTWNTIAPNFVSATAVSQLGSVAIVNYINSIPVGQPINLFDLEVAFQASIAGLFDIQYLSKMLWTITINGIDTLPASNTFLVYGDPESYFYLTSANVTISQG